VGSPLKEQSVFMSRTGLLRRLVPPLMLLFAIGLIPLALAQNDSKPTEDANKAAAGQPQADPAKADRAKEDQATEDQSGDPLKRPVEEKRREKNAKALKEELSKDDKDWLNKDVTYIISPEERKAFMQLSNEEEREQFIESFWDRRNPDPDSEDNEFKDEHYRRIEYANEHFQGGKPGWMTDRGRIYIVYGPPDEIDAHPGGGIYNRSEEEGGGQTETYPFEDWRYRYIEGIGQQVVIEFVDDCMCGAYEMTIDRGRKDALKNVPGAGETTDEEMGLASRADRVHGGLETLGTGLSTENLQTKEFDRLDQYAKLNSAPAIKFKDLVEKVGTHITYNPMPFDVRVDFVKITSDTVLVPITVQLKNRDITFNDKEGVQHGVVNIFGRITALSGKVAQTFEDSVVADVPAELLPREIESFKIYAKSVPLRPGRYKLDLVVKDVNGDRVGTRSQGIIVPDFSDEKLTNSSLILADMVEPVPTSSIGTGMFVIGTTKVRPRVASADGKPASFRHGQKVNFWMQVYNLGVDEKTHRPSATFEYDIVNAATNKAVVHAVESSDKMGNIGDQVTLHKEVAAASLVPGTYKIQIKVSDNISKQTVDPSASFAVE
jgi:GWxTD domain-containing protein